MSAIGCPMVFFSFVALDGGGDEEHRRGPMIPGVRRTVLAFFRPVKGYAAASALVSPGVIPYRPNRGLHLTMTRFAEPHGADAHEDHRWEDQVAIPALLELDGVAGAWTFALDRHQVNGLGLRSSEASDPPGGLRIRLLYLDDDPVGVTGAVSECLRQNPSGTPAGECVIETPLNTIIPWQDW